MNRGTLKIEASHTDEIRVSLTLSDDGTVWMTVEEIALAFGVLAASVQREIRKSLPLKNFSTMRYGGNSREHFPMADFALRSIITSICSLPYVSR